jgi:hypothetical protein
MSRVLIFLALIGLVPLTSEMALGADKNGAFAPKGVGIDKCSDLTQLAKAQDQRVALAASWLDGYITAFNTFSQGVYDVAPWQSNQILLGLIVAHCEKNPGEPLAITASRLIEFMLPGRLEIRGEPIEVKSGDRSMRIYGPVLRRAQEQLIKQGFLTGSADGQFGPKTRTAFESFQAKAGIEKTGLPDQETLARLLIPAPS